MYAEMQNHVDFLSKGWFASPPVTRPVATRHHMKCDFANSNMRDSIQSSSAKQVDPDHVAQAARDPNQPLLRHVYRCRYLILAVSAFILAGTLLLLLLVADGLTNMSVEDWILLTASLGLGVVSLLPAVASMRRSGTGFDLVHPLFYAAWFFFWPQFVVAGALVAFGAINISLESLLVDGWQDRMSSLGLAYLGSIGLSMGYLLPLGKRLSQRMPELHVLKASPAAVYSAALIFLGLGFMAFFQSFREGLVGYQFNTETSLFEGTIAFLSLLANLGQGIVWYCLFRFKKGWQLPALLAMVLILLNVVISGSRGALFHAVLIVVAGYQYAQEHKHLAKMQMWLPVLAAALVFGMIFGSLFRTNKTDTVGRVSSTSLSELIDISSYTASDIRQRAAGDLLQYGRDRIIERLDGISSLAVITAHADRLKSAEEAYDVRNNIIQELTIAFIPRFLWPSKPLVGGSEEIGNLYFKTQFSSPAVTYMGDLYRNFGVWGVLPGMLILGIILRFIYAWLIEGHSLTPMRVGLYLLFATTVNYEGLYSAYIPTLIRTGVIAALALAIVILTQRLFASRRSRFLPARYS